jgi:hypothetical protein
MPETASAPVRPRRRSFRDLVRWLVKPEALPEAETEVRGGAPSIPLRWLLSREHLPDEVPPTASNQGGSAQS